MPAQASVGAGREQGLQGGGFGAILRELTRQGGEKPPQFPGETPEPWSSSSHSEEITGLLHSHLQQCLLLLISHPPAAAREIRDDRNS